MDMPVSVVVVHSAMRSGLMVENLTRQLGEFFGAKEGHGVLVRSVEKGSRADKAGFRAGDVIVRVDKDSVHDSSDFSHALQSHRSGGGPVTVGIIREKREQTITLTLPEHKESGELFGNEDIALPDIEGELHLDQLETEMARIKPQMDLAIQQARRASEEYRKNLLEHQKTLRQQMRQQNSDMRNQWRSQQKEIQRELLELQRGENDI
jgi:membrane-associated protease RseP (regulator of RpoE activity)